MQIILDLSDEKVALLKTAALLENQQRRKLSIDLEAEGCIEASKLFRRDLTLTEYAIATLMDAVKKEVSERG